MNDKWILYDMFERNDLEPVKKLRLRAKKKMMPYASQIGKESW